MMLEKIIIMLTHNDKTVPDAIEIFDENKDLPIQYWGFKDVGMEPAKMKILCDKMHEAGKTAFLEVVSYSEEECMRGAKLAVDCGFDYLLGTLYYDSVAAYIKEQLTGNYFVAENAVDILQHEMHHKEHWDYIRTKALTSSKSGAIVKQEIEADLREYVHNQLASDPAYIRETVSRNAANGFQRYASLNELIADALRQKDKGVAKDSVLLKLVEGVVYDDSNVR